jgi:Peptidase S24-like
MQFQCYNKSVRDEVFFGGWLGPCQGSTATNSVLPTPIKSGTLLISCANSGPAIKHQKTWLASIKPRQNQWLPHRVNVPNPAFTSCFRVKGNSMSPAIQGGYIIAMDASQVEGSKLYGRIVVAWHKDKGLIVSRLQRFDGTEFHGRQP